MREKEIEFWAGSGTSPDVLGWYVNLRDPQGNILDVLGPFATRDEARDGLGEV